MTFVADNLDCLIIAELSLDSRQSFRRVAGKLGVSVATVIKRVERLKLEKIIKGFTLDVDFEKLGFDLTALIHVRTLRGASVEIEKEIAKLNGPVAIYDVTGPSDAVVVAKFRNRQELNKFVKTVLRLPNVERSDTQIVLEIAKEGFGKFF